LALGRLFFLLWLLFEDLARKYLGSMIVFFAKDTLLAVAYLSFFLPRAPAVEVFKIPFLVPLCLFIALAAIQMFNTWSRSVLVRFGWA